MAQIIDGLINLSFLMHQETPTRYLQHIDILMEISTHCYVRVIDHTSSIKICFI